MAAYTTTDAYAAIPKEVQSRKAYGFLKFLVSYDEGVLEEMVPAAVAEIKAMPSYLGHQFFIDAGKSDEESRILKTENCLSWAGCVKLAHADAETLQRDCTRLEELEKCGLFCVRAVKEATTAMVVVDPFSPQGPVWRHACADQGYKVIAVYGGNLEKYEKLKNLIPKDITLEFDAVLGFDDGDLSKLISELRAFNWDIKGVIAGAETGVELADALSEHMGLITNGTLMTDARRNKFVMGETVRSAGISRGEAAQGDYVGGDPDVLGGVAAFTFQGDCEAHRQRGGLMA